MIEANNVTITREELLSLRRVLASALSIVETKLELEDEEKLLKPKQQRQDEKRAKKQR